MQTQLTAQSVERPRPPKDEAALRLLAVQAIGTAADIGRYVEHLLRVTDEGLHDYGRGYAAIARRAAEELLGSLQKLEEVA